jgi:ribosomal protein S18 acetylase RimI-like enzyme
MSAEIHYQRLNADNFTGYSLDDFVRHQTVTECWRKIDNDWKLVSNIYEENWSQVQCREIAEDVVHHINLDQTGLGAFDGERIIGFATVSHRLFGTAARYMQLVCFQVSEEYRHQGIGRKLFSMACEEARRLGADKLYISAHSSKESQAAYRALGCSFAEEINEELAAAEPFDVQMEYRL